MLLRLFAVSLVFLTLLSGCEYLRPDSNFVATPDNGVAPLEVSFENRSLPGLLPIMSYEWDFGDGSPHANDASPSHIYQKPGEYTVTLTTRDFLCRDIFKREGIITVIRGNLDVLVDFSISPEKGQAPLSVSFMDISKLDNIVIRGWFWQFGDGGTSYMKNPIHTYRKSGVYTVILSINTDLGIIRRVKSKAVDVYANPSEGEPIEGEPAEGELAEGEPIEGELIEGEPGEGEPTEGEPAEGELAEGEPIEGETLEGELIEGEPIEGETLEGELIEGEPAEGEPAEGEPAEGEPIEGEPAEGELAEGEPVEGELIEGETLEGELIEGEPVEGEPVEGELIEGELVEGEPVEGELIEGEPVEGEPVEGELIEGEPVEGEPVEGELIEGEPVEGEPVEGELIEGEPVEGEPVEGELIEGEPVEGEPVEGELIEGEPVEGEPVEGELIEGELVEGEPVEGELIEGEPVEGEPVEGELIEGEPIEGESVEGEFIEGEPVEGEPIEGEPVEGELIEGEPVEGEPIEGELIEGEPIEGEPVEGEPAEGEAEPICECPPDTIFSQPATVPGTTGYTPKYYLSNDKVRPYLWENLSAASSVYVSATLSDVHWWGVQVDADGLPCDAALTSFIIDVADKTYTPLASYTVEADRTQANFSIVADDIEFPVYSYNVMLPIPCTIASDTPSFINIRKNSSLQPGCRFGWLNTVSGGEEMWLDSAAGQADMPQWIQDNLAFCLTGAETPQNPWERLAINIKRTVEGDSVYTPGEDVTVDVRFERYGEGEVTSLTLMEALPEGWVYRGMAAGVIPDEYPATGASGEIVFSWSNAPPFPFELHYTATAPVSDAVQLFTGVASYMVSGEILFSNEVLTQFRRFQTILTTDRVVNKKWYASGQVLDITVPFQRFGVETPLVFGYIETLPDGWLFQEIVENEGIEPDVFPKVNTTGTLEFAWLSPPPMPGTFTYRILVPQDATGLARFSGYALYRFTDIQFNTPQVETVLPRFQGT